MRRPRYRRPPPPPGPPPPGPGGPPPPPRAPARPRGGGAARPRPPGQQLEPLAAAEVPQHPHLPRQQRHQLHPAVAVQVPGAQGQRGAPRLLVLRQREAQPVGGQHAQVGAHLRVDPGRRVQVVEQPRPRVQRIPPQVPLARSQPPHQVQVPAAHHHVQLQQQLHAPAGSPGAARPGLHSLRNARHAAQPPGPEARQQQLGHHLHQPGRGGAEAAHGQPEVELPGVAAVKGGSELRVEVRHQAIEGARGASGRWPRGGRQEHCQGAGEEAAIHEVSSIRPMHLTKRADRTIKETQNCPGGAGRFLDKPSRC